MAKPFRADAGVQMTNSASWLGATGMPGVYYKTAVGLVVRKPDNSEQTLGGGVTWPLTNGTATNTYNSAVTDGASAVGHQFTTTNTFATDGDKVLVVQSPSGTDWLSVGRLSSQNAFTFTGNSNGSGTGPLFIKAPTGNAGLTLDATGGGGRIYQHYSTTAGEWVLADITAGANRWKMDANGALCPYANNTVNLGLPTTNEMAAVYTVLTRSRRIAGLSGTPGIAAGTGAGTGPSVSMGTNSNDSAGLLNISTGTAPAGSNATIATITFNGTYATAPFVVLTPASNSAAGLAVGAVPFVDPTATTTTTFVLKSGGTALGASTAFKWQYTVIG